MIPLIGNRNPGGTGMYSPISIHGYSIGRTMEMQSYNLWGGAGEIVSSSGLQI